ncbi:MULTISPECIES: YiiX/YebB-like N1pC/P60 family cysteine hydrolase [Pseudomonas]|uniref:Permuted papain-like amidase enzyme, YaeF/YiiX, C92 family n=1 Tax=Pseudomonas lutea TaxID=243924 RepID=A0A9X8MH16_9PSED|nr:MULTISPECIES: YiiX/YebB-like N1pC/P60 family cysteine hydrolase [Pseudomonas]SER35792.1 Permuted papain-like amidase enzyme, YaeF/YiiX, C92 family [Pseudomonas lutea]
MESVVLLYSRTATPHSLAIRLFNGSPWSHVEFVDGPNVIGALPGGVRIDKLEDRLRSVSSYAFVRVPCPDARRVLTMAYTQLGKPYDFLGILGLVTRFRDWSTDDKWFCSELVAWCFSQAQWPLFREDQIWRLTPLHLWMQAHPTVTSESVRRRPAFSPVPSQDIDSCEPE